MIKVKITGENFNVELSYYGNMKHTAEQQCEKELRWFADMIRKNNFHNHKIEIENIMSAGKRKKKEEAAYTEKLLDRLRRDPKFNLRQELGTLLMRHIDSFTPEERARYNELLILCKD